MLGAALAACAPRSGAALEGAWAPTLDWRATVDLEHQDRMNRLRRLGVGRLGAAPVITEDRVEAADLPRGVGVAVPVARVVFSERVFFETNSAELTEAGRAIAGVVAEALRREASDTAVFVAGHTDSRADDTYNYGLSVRRADAVARALFAAGVRQARIWRVGFGEALPLAANDSDEHMARNRRVEFLFARKAEAASLWLARQPVTLCGSGACGVALARLPRVVAEPVTRAAVGRDDVVPRSDRRSDAEADAPDRTGTALPRVRVEHLTALKPARADVPSSAAERVDVVIRREDPVVIDLREERVLVGRPQR